MDWTTPLGAPFYPALPALYQNVKFQLVRFAARREAIGAFLPAPLEPREDGVCVAAGLDIPYSSNYGAFQEAFLLLGCRFRGEPGYYCSHVFHNGPAGIAAGREIYGTPKVFAEIALEQSGHRMWTEARMAGEPVMRVDTQCSESIDPALLPVLAPSWRLKLIPRADRPEPAIKQLIDGSRAGQNQVVHGCARGAGTVAFSASRLVDLTPLAPANHLGAWYFETSYEEHFAEIVHDYLAETG